MKTNLILVIYIAHFDMEAPIRYHRDDSLTCLEVVRLEDKTTRQEDSGDAYQGFESL